jgi:hypothetical protein
MMTDREVWVKAEAILAEHGDDDRIYHRSDRRSAAENVIADKAP